MVVLLQTPLETKIFENVDRIMLPTHAGDACILPQHEPMVFGLGNGKIEFLQKSFWVEGGAARVQDNMCYIFVEEVTFLEKDTAC